VEVDFSDVDPSWKNRKMIQIQQWQLSTSDDSSDQSNSELILLINESDPQDGDFGSSSDESKSAVGGRELDSLERRLKIKNNLFKICGS
jgi:hypothetical protein